MSELAALALALFGVLAFELSLAAAVLLAAYRSARRPARRTAPELRRPDFRIPEPRRPDLRIPEPRNPEHDVTVRAARPPTHRE